MRLAPVLFLFLYSPLAFAQEKATSTATAAGAGCGDDSAKFDVKNDKHQHPLTQPAEGKALVYFIEDDSQFASIFKPTTRVGLDGAWTGATHGDSYFYFSVEPGEHHLCASWQAQENTPLGRKAAAAHFTAHAGDVFYFRARNIFSKEWSPSVDLDPVDSDEAQLLMSTFSFSTSRPRQ